MHILLTDILTCPRCGPQHGLILLADRMAERRVLEGALGCANCREKYPIRDGAIDFVSVLPAVDDAGRPDGDTRGAASPSVQAAASEQANAQASAVRLAALMGVTQGPGYILLAGACAPFASAIAGMIEAIEVVAAARPGAAPEARSGAGTNRIDVANVLPLASGRVAGVALTGAAANALLEEGCRVLSPLGRLVLEPAPADAAQRIEACGARIIAREGDTVVAANRHAAPRG